MNSSYYFVGSIAEGNFNFTSTSAPSKEDVTEIESDEDESEREIETETTMAQNEDDLQIVDNPTQLEHEEVNGGRPAGAATRNKLPKKPKKSPKKRNADGIVQVMERLVKIKEKEANQEAAQTFSISRCMDAFKTLEGFSADEKILALEVFKVADNREIFVNLVADKDDTAVPWLRAQIAKLT
jgi:hypothetical protein